MERRGPFYTTQDGSGTWKKGGTNVLEHLYRDRNVLVIAGTAGHKRVGLCQTCPPVNQTQAKIIAGGRGWGRGEGGMRKLLFVMQCPISSENQAKKGAENFLAPAGINRVVGHKRVGGGGGGACTCSTCNQTQAKIIAGGRVGGKWGEGFKHDRCSLAYTLHQIISSETIFTMVSSTFYNRCTQCCGIFWHMSGGV
jgi:hypothetical protein